MKAFYARMFSNSVKTLNSVCPFYIKLNGSKCLFKSQLLRELIFIKIKQGNPVLFLLYQIILRQQ